MTSWASSLLLLAVGVLIGSVLMVGVQLAGTDNESAAANIERQSRTTPTPCEDFYHATVFLSGSGAGNTALSMVVLNPDAITFEGPYKQRVSALAAMLQRCIEYAGGFR